MGSSFSKKQSLSRTQSRSSVYSDGSSEPKPLNIVPDDENLEQVVNKEEEAEEEKEQDKVNQEEEVTNEQEQQQVSPSPTKLDIETEDLESPSQIIQTPLVKVEQPIDNQLIIGDDVKVDNVLVPPETEESSSPASLVNGATDQVDSELATPSNDNNDDTIVKVVVEEKEQEQQVEAVSSNVEAVITEEPTTKKDISNKNERPKRLKRADTFKQKLYSTFTRKKSSRFNEEDDQVQVSTQEDKLKAEQTISSVETNQVTSDTVELQDFNHEYSQNVNTNNVMVDDAAKTTPPPPSQKDRPQRKKKATTTKYHTFSTKISTLKKRIFNSQLQEAEEEFKREKKDRQKEKEDEMMSMDDEYVDDIYEMDEADRPFPLQSSVSGSSSSTNSITSADDLDYKTNPHKNNNNNKPQKKKFFSAEEFYNFGALISKEVGHVFLLSSGYKYN